MERGRAIAQPPRPSFICFLLPALLTTPTSATTPAAKAAFGLGTRFVDIQRAAIQLSSIQLSDRTIRFRISAHLNKPEAAGLPGIAVGNDVYALHGSIRLEQRSNRSFGSSEVEVSYENILHAFSFYLRNWLRSEERTRAVGPD